MRLDDAVTDPVIALGGDPDAAGADSVANAWVDACNGGAFCARNEPAVPVGPAGVMVRLHSDTTSPAIGNSRSNVGALAALVRLAAVTTEAMHPSIVRLHLWRKLIVTVFR